jgi:uncharacterized protein (TIGR02145 family)
MNKKQYFYSNLFAWGLVLLLIGNHVFGWTTPSQDPPGGNVVLETGATPAGSTGYIQFNDAGNLGADFNLFWDNTNKRLGIGETTPKNKLDVEGGGVIGAAYSGTNTAPSNGLLVQGNVGIGTVTPNNLLSVYQLIDFNNTDYNTKLGYQAGKNIVEGATRNTFIGYQAGMASSTASTNAADYNTGIGYQTLYLNTTGQRNTANGHGALRNNTTGSYNTANGMYALLNNTTGNYNTAVGDSVLNYNTTGTGSIALGYRAGYNNTTGSNNIVIGYQTDLPAVDSSNMLSIGNLIYATGLTAFANPSSAVSSGNVGIGTTSPGTKLEVAGAIKVGTQDTCNAAAAGAIRYDSTAKRFYGCNGSGWVSLNSSCGYPVTFTYKGSTVTYGTVYNPITGRCWMDRNLGASRVATAYNDSSAYGDLFQWGRLDDGHQTRTSGTTTTLSTSDVPGHSNFIKSGSSPYDWRSPQNNDLWQGVFGINNPCPPGWRIPTESEWTAEMNSWSSMNYNGAYTSPLKLTAGGHRNYLDGSLVSLGVSGLYWSSSVVDTNARRLDFGSTYARTSSVGHRAAGYSVRCVQD